VNVPDAQLEEKLATKLRYVRGYDNTFDYFALGVKDGWSRSRPGSYRRGPRRSSCRHCEMPGVKDVIDRVSVEPVSIFDDGLRCGRSGLYRDSVLSKYAMDPARPIRIIVTNGMTLYGSVDSKMTRTLPASEPTSSSAPSASTTSCSRLKRHEVDVAVAKRRGSTLE